jgi:anti-anti-sigma factor
MRLRTETYFWGDVTICRVVINLTEVDHIDSAALAALVHLLTQKRDPESGARLVSSRMRVTELLRRTKLDTVIMVYASEEEAIASFPKKQSSSPDSKS